MNVAIHADGSAAITMTNQAQAEQFLANTNRNITKADLTTYTQVRLIVRITTGSASVNTPQIALKYHTAFSVTLGDFVDIGTSAVVCSLTTAGHVESSWINLAAGAKADVYMAVTQSGGDAVADPAVGHIFAQCR